MEKIRQGKQKHSADLDQYDKSVADYTKVIDSPPEKYGDVKTSPVARELVTMVARALCNRADIYLKLGEKEKALIDVNRVIEKLIGVSDEEKNAAMLIREKLA